MVRHVFCIFICCVSLFLSSPAHIYNTVLTSDLNQAIVSEGFKSRSSLGPIALRGGSIVGQYCPKLIVTNATDVFDADGRSVEFLVEADSPNADDQNSVRSCEISQEELDELITKGSYPSLAFSNCILADRFQDCQRKNIPVSLRLADRADSESSSKHENARPDSTLDDVRYFVSYGDLRVHELMLKDLVRSEWYLHEIRSHNATFACKAVPDVGAGTGLLSLFPG